jgi:hypothetical protein
MRWRQLLQQPHWRQLKTLTKLRLVAAGVPEWLTVHQLRKALRRMLKQAPAL